MTDKTPTIAMAHAPASSDKTALISAIQGVLDAIDTAVTNSVSGTAQVNTVTITGTPTAGTYTLTFVDSVNGTRVTSALAYNASAATVQAAIRLLAGLELSTVSATGSTPNFVHTITFKGLLAATTLTVQDSTTGGTHNFAVAITQAYAAIARISANAALVCKAKLINWAEDLASNLRRV